MAEHGLPDGRRNKNLTKGHASGNRPLPDAGASASNTPGAQDARWGKKPQERHAAPRTRNCGGC